MFPDGDYLYAACLLVVLLATSWQGLLLVRAYRTAMISHKAMAANRSGNQPTSPSEAVFTFVIILTAALAACFLFNFLLAVTEVQLFGA